jgi:hypothetical protein
MATSNLLSIDPSFLGGGLPVKVFFGIIALLEAAIAIVKFIKLFAKDGTKLDKICDKILERLGETKAQQEAKLEAQQETAKAVDASEKYQVVQTFKSLEGEKK